VVNTTTSLERPSPQWIFAPEVRAQETRLFDRAPLYLGPSRHISEGFLRVPPWANDLYLACGPDKSPVQQNSQTQLRSQTQVRSNVCLHWQADILQASGDGFLPFNASILCKSHNAVYSAESGKLLNPHLFKQTCKHVLPPVPTVEWQGFLFKDAAWEGLSSHFSLRQELARVEAETGSLFQAEGYRLMKTIEMEQAGNWALFVLNYLDLLHVDPAHSETLAQLCDCSDVHSYPGLNYSSDLQAPGRWTAVQQVGWKKSWGEGSSEGWNDPSYPRRGKAAYHQWGKIYREAKGNPPLGAVWATIFPHLMLEWYPGVIVMSQVFPHPSDPSRCKVYHDFYGDQELLEHPDFLAVQQVAFHATGDEDESMVGSMSRNLMRFARQGLNAPMGFVHPQLEDCSPFYYARLIEVLAELGIAL
jgi:choline monooxygenase